MGSSSQLRRFDCNIQKNKQGQYEVRFRPKERQQSFAACSESNFQEWVSEKSDVTTTSFVGPYDADHIRLHRRNQSVNDLAACDDIVQQFIVGLEDKLSRSFHERDGKLFEVMSTKSGSVGNSSEHMSFNDDQFDGTPLTSSFQLNDSTKLRL